MKIVNTFLDLNDNYMDLDRIIDEIRKRYPEQYSKIESLIGENIQNEISELSDFEKQLYNDDSIFDLPNLIYNPKFLELVYSKTETRPSVMSPDEPR